MSEHMQDSLSQPEDEQAKVAFEDDEIQFAEETETDHPEKSWKILIVDDEAEVHDITKLALSDVTFEERSLTFLSAYSAEEAKQIVQANPDIAIIFLDVVMETDDAGLQLIDYIREDLGNLTTRIILRTGQPGQAPEDIVAVNYGINDYKTKTELTARKLFITVITALRTFSTIIQMLEVSQRLELQLTQDKQSDEVHEQEKIRQLERKLQSLQSHLSQPNQRQQPEATEQLAAIAAAPDASTSSATGTLHTMSMVARIARMVLRIMDGQSTRLGLSQSKLAVLMYLSGEPDLCASPSTLAKHCGVSRAAMTGLLDGLEKEDYVERDSHPSDRRALRVKLTSSGRQFLEQIAPQQYQMSELMEALDATERQTLIELIMKFIRLLDNQPDPIED
ncbi:MAG: MarR family transcriptional regulator [Leptolyngbya sp. SIO1E4]|nr:MarR family transcriptional regulator [Leptolyngbya sp. SIO1E4]